MSSRYLFALIMGTAVATYLLRLIPMALLRHPLRNRYLVALLEYMPYALLSAMIFPDIFYATAADGVVFPMMPPLPSIVGGVVALVLAFFRLSLPLVASIATVAAFLVTLV